MKTLKIVFAAGCILAVLLAACGDNGHKAATSSGIFADAVVQGLHYECDSTSGTTNESGTFTCPTNSDVSFWVGDFLLCSAPLQAFMTPLSCVQTTDPTANTSTPAVLNVVRFLMSLSSTPASSGTLTITQAVHDGASGLALPALYITTATEAELANLIDMIQPGATLVDAATAEAQLLDTVFAQFAGSYSGTFSGDASGTWQATVNSENGSVTGSGTIDGDGTVPVSGSLTSGTTYSGTTGTAQWTGTLNTSQEPAVFSGTWNDPVNMVSGTFTGTKVM